MSLALTLGRFYRTRSGRVWCCFAIDLKRDEAHRARCIEVKDGGVSFFFADGRYHDNEAHPHNLVAEVFADGSDFDIREFYPYKVGYAHGAQDVRSRVAQFLEGDQGHEQEPDGRPGRPRSKS